MGEVNPDLFEIQELKRCSKCTTHTQSYATKSAENGASEVDEDAKVEEILATLKERQKRTILRKIKTGEIEYNAKKNVLVYAEG
jgi:hypothetical protein